MRKVKIALRLEQDEDGYPPFAVETVWAIATARSGHYEINIPSGRANTGLAAAVALAALLVAGCAQPQPVVMNRGTSSDAVHPERWLYWRFVGEPSERQRFELRVEESRSRLVISYRIGATPEDARAYTLEGTGDGRALVLRDRTGVAEFTAHCTRERVPVRAADAHLRLDCKSRNPVVWSGPEVLWDAWVCVPRFREDGGLTRAILGERWTLGADPGIEEIVDTCWYFDFGQRYSGLRILQATPKPTGLKPF